jgi:hypothetical protein
MEPEADERARTLRAGFAGPVAGGCTGGREYIADGDTGDGRSYRCGRTAPRENDDAAATIRPRRHLYVWDHAP